MIEKVDRESAVAGRKVHGVTVVCGGVLHAIHVDGASDTDGVTVAALQRCSGSVSTTAEDATREVVPTDLSVVVVDGPNVHRNTIVISTSATKRSGQVIAVESSDLVGGQREAHVVAFATTCGDVSLKLHVGGIVVGHVNGAGSIDEHEKGTLLSCGKTVCTENRTRRRERGNAHKELVTHGVSPL